MTGFHLPQARSRAATVDKYDARLSTGGILYDRLGWHAPFIAVIILLGADALFRALIIERRNYPELADKVASPNEDGEISEQKVAGASPQLCHDPELGQAIETHNPIVSVAQERDSPGEDVDVILRATNAVTVSSIDRNATEQANKPHLSAWEVICRVLSSPRTISALTVEFCCITLFMSTDVV